MEDRRHEEPVERAGCDVRVARGGVPGVEVVTNPCYGCLLHPAHVLAAIKIRFLPHPSLSYKICTSELYAQGPLDIRAASTAAALRP